MPESTILERTQFLLRQDGRNLAELQRATGLNYFWLRKMRKGLIKNPSVNRVEQLLKALSPAC